MDGHGHAEKDGTKEKHKSRLFNPFKTKSSSKNHNQQDAVVTNGAENNNNNNNNSTDVACENSENNNNGESNHEKEIVVPTLTRQDSNSSINSTYSNASTVSFSISTTSAANNKTFESNNNNNNNNSTINRPRSKSEKKDKLSINTLISKASRKSMKITTPIDPTQHEPITTVATTNTTTTTTTTTNTSTVSNNPLNSSSNSISSNISMDDSLHVNDNNNNNNNNRTILGTGSVNSNVLSAQEKKKNRGSIFVRLLSRKNKDDPISEEDFKIESQSLANGGSLGSNQPSIQNQQNQQQFTSSPNLLSTSYSFSDKDSLQQQQLQQHHHHNHHNQHNNNNHSGNNTHHTHNHSLTTSAVINTQRNRNNNNIDNTITPNNTIRNKEMEREETIKKIQLMATQLNENIRLPKSPRSNSSSNGSNILLSGNVTPPRIDRQTSESFLTTISTTPSSNHTQINPFENNNTNNTNNDNNNNNNNDNNNNINNISNNNNNNNDEDNETDYSIDSGINIETTSGTSSILTNNQHIQNNHQNTLVQSPSSNSLSMSSSSVFTTPITQSPVITSQPSSSSQQNNNSNSNSNNSFSSNNRHKRYTVAIPKWDQSMNFNGNPFERLVQVLRSSGTGLGVDEKQHQHQQQLLEEQQSRDLIQLQLHLQKLDGTNNSSNNSSTVTTTTSSSSSNTTTVSTSSAPITSLSSSVRHIPQSIIDGIEEEKQKRVILLYSLKKMLLKLISESSDDSILFKSFFTTYECIFSSRDILNELISLFKSESPQIQLRICSIIKCWLKDYNISQLCDYTFASEFKDFVMDIKNTHNSYLYGKIFELRNQLIYLLETKITERCLDLNPINETENENNNDNNNNNVNKKENNEIEFENIENNNENCEINKNNNKNDNNSGNQDNNNKLEDIKEKEKENDNIENDNDNNNNDNNNDDDNNDNDNINDENNNINENEEIKKISLTNAELIEKKYLNKKATLKIKTFLSTSLKSTGFEFDLMQKQYQSSSTPSPPSSPTQNRRFSPQQTNDSVLSLTSLENTSSNTYETEYDLHLTQNQQPSSSSSHKPSRTHNRSSSIGGNHNHQQQQPSSHASIISSPSISFNNGNNISNSTSTSFSSVNSSGNSNSNNNNNNNNTFWVQTRPRSSTWSSSDIFLSIMDAPAKEIAKSLTAIDFSIFICIETQELMNGAWGKPHLKDKAPNIIKLINRFNEISMNVIQTILNEEKLKDRCKVMARFIKIAKNLHELHNYNSLMAIYAGISHSSITRLKWTKKILPKTHQKTLSDLEKLMESDENFKNYRNELKTITTPCIPFLGLILSDMTFIQEGNTDYCGINEDSWSLNLNKLKLMYNCIKQIQNFQKTAYLLNADPRLTLILTPNSNIFGEPIQPPQSQSPPQQQPRHHHHNTTTTSTTVTASNTSITTSSSTTTTNTRTPVPQVSINNNNNNKNNNNNNNNNNKDISPSMYGLLSPRSQIEAVILPSLSSSTDNEIPIVKEPLIDQPKSDDSIKTTTPTTTTSTSTSTTNNSNTRDLKNIFSIPEFESTKKIPLEKKSSQHDLLYRSFTLEDQEKPIRKYSFNTWSSPKKVNFDYFNIGGLSSSVSTTKTTLINNNSDNNNNNNTNNSSVGNNENGNSSGDSSNTVSPIKMERSQSEKYLPLKTKQLITPISLNLLTNYGIGCNIDQNQNNSNNSNNNNSNNNNNNNMSTFEKILESNLSSNLLSSPRKETSPSSSSSSPIKQASVETTENGMTDSSDLGGCAGSPTLPRVNNNNNNNNNCNSRNSSSGSGNCSSPIVSSANDNNNNSLPTIITTSAVTTSEINSSEEDIKKSNGSDSFSLSSELDNTNNNNGCGSGVASSSSSNTSSIISEELLFLVKGQQFTKNRRKSVSTSNIHSINPSSPTSGSLLKSNGLNTPRSANNSPQNGNSGSTSPSAINNISSQSNQIINQPSPSSQSSSLIYHQPSSSLFKRKSFDPSHQAHIIPRPAHSFVPMSDEGLFSLSLKLEPRGVKLSDLT
ncbi:hypothetical protein ACTFIW_006371 [Dictyostelium discoideum]